MDSATINHVLNNNTLPNGTVWTMPILLHVREDDAERSKIGEKVTLKGRDGRFYAILEISEVFELDLDELALKWFTTTSHEHLGVARLFKEGKHFLAGEIKLLERPSQNSTMVAPKQTRLFCSQRLV